MCLNDTSGARLQAHSIDPADDDRRGILTGPKKDLRARKQELVRNAIIDAAIAGNGLIRVAATGTRIDRVLVHTSTARWSRVFEVNQW